MSTSPSIRRTSTILADGRELIYFDDDPEFVSGTRTHRLDDPRPLGDRFATANGEPFQGPEMRFDVLTGEWVPMASHRMNRTFMPAADSCPLCPAVPGAAYSDGEIPDTAYDVVAFENRFPSLMMIPGQDGPGYGTHTDGDPLWSARPAAGRCEVLCFTDDHSAAFASLSPQRVRTVIEAWADRTTVLSAMPGIEQVFCFENRGKEIGVTLQHPHGQIYAYPYLAPKMDAYLRQAAIHMERTGRNLLSDILEAEKRSGRRIVLESEHWTAYVPAAARWPVEVHLAPNRDVLDIPGLTDAERDDLATTYLKLLGMLDRFFVEEDGTAITLPYIAGWHQAPVNAGRELGRLHLQIISVLRAPGKLKYLAGSESGMGAWISDTTPERIADRLREVSQ